MKKILVIALCLLALSCSAGERKSTRDFMLVGRDFSLFDEPAICPLSAGLTSWTDKDLGHMPALYASAAMLSYKEIVRFEAGGAVTWGKSRNYPNITLITGLSTKITERIIVGAWYAPFWGLVKAYPDDPWGIMIGYTFSL